MCYSLGYSVMGSSQRSRPIPRVQGSYPYLTVQHSKHKGSFQYGRVIFTVEGSFQYVHVIFTVEGSFQYGRVKLHGTQGDLRHVSVISSRRTGQSLSPKAGDLKTFSLLNSPLIPTTSRHTQPCSPMTEPWLRRAWAMAKPNWASQTEKPKAIVQINPQDLSTKIQLNAPLYVEFIQRN